MMKKQKTITYADSVKIPVYIKPKENKKDEQSSITKNGIKNVLVPSSLSVEIKNVQEMHNNGVVINCNNKDSADKIQNELVEKMGTDYEIFSPKVRNPYFLIVGMSNCLSTENINAIKLQNDINFKEIKCHKVYESFKKKNVFSMQLLRLMVKLLKIYHYAVN